MSAATWVRFYLMMTIGERVITDMRRAVFDHLLALEPAFFEQIRTGEVISRLTNDATQLQAVIGFGVSMFLRNALMGSARSSCSSLTSGKLAALVVLGVPATLVPILLLGRRVRRLSRANQDRVADVSALRRRVDARDPHRAGLRPRGRGPRSTSASARRPRTRPASSGSATRRS